MVGPDVEIVLDGGVRRGIDIVKGLARGADSVAIGPSPFTLALALALALPQPQPQP